MAATTTKGNETMYSEAYLQFGTGTQGPFQTVSAAYKHAPMAHHLRGLQWTASGYGRAIPYEHMVTWERRWRHVYAFRQGNTGKAFLRATDGRCLLTVDLN